MTVIEVKQAKEFASSFFGDPILKWAVNRVLDNVPCFEVVQCKDCKRWLPWSDKTQGTCPCSEHVTKAGHFCSYGERKGKCE